MCTKFAIFVHLCEPRPGLRILVTSAMSWSPPLPRRPPRTLRRPSRAVDPSANRQCGTELFSADAVVATVLATGADESAVASGPRARCV